MPVKLTNGQWITPTTEWQQMPIDAKIAKEITADANFYIGIKIDD
jgi:hypothetical protein